MNEPQPVVLEAEGLVKTYADVGRKIEVLRGVELQVAKGDRLAIVGSSGSGKTTLLQLLGGLDEPTAGEVRVAGESMTRANDVDRGRLRNRALGSFTSSITCFPSSRRSRTSPCRCSCVALRRRKQPMRRAACSSAWDSGSGSSIALASSPAANANARLSRARS
jgi:energy-coupling factor transporter ATP-binding protein EcfA2